MEDDDFTVALEVDGEEPVNLGSGNETNEIILGRGMSSSSFLRSRLNDPSISRQHLRIEALPGREPPSVRLTVMGANRVMISRRQQPSDTLSCKQSAVLEVGDAFMFSRGFNDVIRVAAPLKKQTFRGEQCSGTDNRNGGTNCGSPSSSSASGAVKDGNCAEVESTTGRLVKVKNEIAEDGEPITGGVDDLQPENLGHVKLEPPPLGQVGVSSEDLQARERRVSQPSSNGRQQVPSIQSEVRDATNDRGVEDPAGVSPDPERPMSLEDLLLDNKIGGTDTARVREKLEQVCSHREPDTERHAADGSELGSPTVHLTSNVVDEALVCLSNVDRTVSSDTTVEKRRVMDFTGRERASYKRARPPEADQGVSSPIQSTPHLVDPSMSTRYEVSPPPSDDQSHMSFANFGSKVATEQTWSHSHQGSRRSDPYQNLIAPSSTKHSHVSCCGCTEAHQDHPDVLTWARTHGYPHDDVRLHNRAKTQGHLHICCSGKVNVFECPHADTCGRHESTCNKAGMETRPEVCEEARKKGCLFDKNSVLIKNPRRDVSGCTEGGGFDISISQHQHQHEQQRGRQRQHQEQHQPRLPQHQPEVLGADVLQLVPKQTLAEQEYFQNESSKQTVAWRCLLCFLETYQTSILETLPGLMGAAYAALFPGYTGGTLAIHESLSLAMKKITAQMMEQQKVAQSTSYNLAAVTEVVRMQNDAIFQQLSHKLGSKMSTLASEMNLLAGLKNKAEAAHRAVETRMRVIQKARKYRSAPSSSGNGSALMPSLTSDSTQHQEMNQQLQQGTTNPPQLLDPAGTFGVASVTSGAIPTSAATSPERVPQHSVWTESQQQAAAWSCVVTTLRLYQDSVLRDLPGLIVESQMMSKPSSSFGGTEAVYGRLKYAILATNRNLQAYRDRQGVISYDHVVMTKILHVQNERFRREVTKLGIDLQELSPFFNIRKELNERAVIAHRIVKERISTKLVAAGISAQRGGHVAVGL